MYNGEDMRFLGIDYGTKKIGLALSDEGGMIAFPQVILPNNNNTLKEIKKICDGSDVGKIILGESLDYAGEPNKILDEIIKFKGELEKNGFAVEMEKEFMTSLFARLGPINEKPVATPRRKEKKVEAVDAKAAALILQRYLDRINRAAL